MNLYLLESLGDYGYDETDGHVVRAVDEASARNMIEPAEEGKQVWLNPDKSTCELIAEGVEGEPAIILTSFNAG